VARDHPRHLVLAALVAGLLLAPAGAAVVLPAAIIAGALGGRATVAVPAAAAVLAGALLADARLSALDAGRLGGMGGRVLESRAVLLEPVRERTAGPAVVRVRLLDGAGAGEQAVLRVRRSAYEARDSSAGGSGGRPEVVRRRPPPPCSGGRPEVGDIVLVKGRVEPLGRWDAYQRRRNAHAAIAAVAVERTGERRGGAAGVLDGVRRRAEAGLASGLAPPEAALARGMVLGEDERLSAAVREDFQRSGLAHILMYVG
jgi:competence protein ComEC